MGKSAYLHSGYIFNRLYLSQCFYIQRAGNACLIRNTLKRFKPYLRKGVQFSSVNLQ